MPSPRGSLVLEPGNPRESPSVFGGRSMSSEAGDWPWRNVTRGRVGGPVVKIARPRQLNESASSIIFFGF